MDSRTATSHWKGHLSFFFLFFSYNSLVKDSLPIKTTLEPIYPQNDIAFAVVLTLTSCLHAGKNGGFHWLQSSNSMPFLRQQKGQRFRCAPCACAIHMQMRVAYSLLEVLAFKVLTESVSFCHLVTPLGGISTNLFLSRFVMTVPSWRRGFVLMTCRRYRNTGYWP